MYKYNSNREPTLKSIKKRSEKVYGFVYVVLNTISDKVYIGQKTRDPQKRWVEFRTKSDNSSAALKYNLEPLIVNYSSFINQKFPIT